MPLTNLCIEAPPSSVQCTDNLVETVKNENVISYTTSVGMTLTLVSFFILLILFILATKCSRYNSRTTGSRPMKLSG